MKISKKVVVAVSAGLLLLGGATYAATDYLTNIEASIVSLKDKANLFYDEAMSKQTITQTVVDEKNKMINDKQSQLESAQSQVTNLTSQLSDAQNQVNQLTAQLNSSASDKSALQTQLDAANAKVAQLTSDLTTANNNLSAVQAQLTDSQNELNTTKSDRDKYEQDLVATQKALDAANAQLSLLKGLDGIIAETDSKAIDKVDLTIELVANQSKKTYKIVNANTVPITVNYQSNNTGTPYSGTITVNPADVEYVQLSEETTFSYELPGTGNAQYTIVK